MPTFNLIKNSDNYSKTLESLWQYCRDEPALNDVGTLASFSGNSVLFKFVEMPSINFEINLILTWSAKFVISNAAANQATPFAITDAKPYGSLVTLSINDNAKLLQQL